MDVLSSSVQLTSTFPLTYDDFNHLGQIPASTMIKYSTEARKVAFATWPALAKLVDESSSLRTKLYLLRSFRPNRLHPGLQLRVVQTPHAVGANSLTLAYEFHDGATDSFAEVLLVMNRRGEDGARLPLPKFVSQDLAWRFQQAEIEDSRELVSASTALETAFPPNVVSSPSTPINQVHVRFSDLETPSSIKAHRLFQFFEDSTSAIGTQLPALMYVEVLGKLALPSAVFDVFGTTNQDTVTVMVNRADKQIVARSFVSHHPKTLQV